MLVAFQFCGALFSCSEYQYPEAGRKDFLCKANSPIEMISIAHHLYVMKSYGITGDFAEFGCFKGFSSSMLSLRLFALEY